MPFGMQNAPATFQQIINHTIAGLEGCAVYLDDVVVYSQTFDDHMLRLRNLLNRLKEANLTVNLMKNEFCHAKITSLGHAIGQSQVAPRYSSHC